MYDISGVRVGKDTRAVHTSVTDGVVTLKGDGYTEKIRLAQGRVVEHKIHRGSNYVYWIKYGEFEKARDTHNYSYIKRFHPKSAKGYHGLTARYDTPLFGQKGVCYTFYSRGRWMWQKFVYSNGRIAYHARERIFKGAVVEGVYPDGKKLFRVECANGFAGRSKEGVPFIHREEGYSYGQDKMDFSKDGNCVYTIWDKSGRIKQQGRISIRQKTGEWIENYKRLHMINGLSVPKKLYDAKPETLDPNRVLKESNAQVRAMLLKKIGFARVVKECRGTLVDRDMTTGNELYDFKTGSKPNEYTQDDIETVERVLKVICPSTKAEYFLRIPYDEHFNTCEKARQGTFTGFDPEAKAVEFALET